MQASSSDFPITSGTFVCVDFKPSIFVVVSTESSVFPPQPPIDFTKKITASAINTIPERIAPIKITLSIFGLSASISSLSPKISSSSSVSFPSSFSSSFSYSYSSFSSYASSSSYRFPDSLRMIDTSSSVIITVVALLTGGAEIWTKSSFGLIRDFFISAINADIFKYLLSGFFCVHFKIIFSTLTGKSGMVSFGLGRSSLIC